MNQEIINVVLMETESGADVLKFEFEPDPLMINLNSDNNQSELRKVFGKLLENMQNKDIELKLNIADGYKRSLYKEVCDAYIKDLNSEIKTVKDEMKDL